MQAALFILALLMGVLMSIYLPMNSAVSRHLGSTVGANVTFYAVGLLFSLVLFVAFGETDALPKYKQVPNYLYLTGVMSALIVLGSSFLIPRIGARPFFILLVAGQVLMAMLVSHFGILESPQDAITWKKVLGAALVVGGAILSRG